MIEDYVQEVLKNWFEIKGFEVLENIKAESGNKVDIIATKGSEKWFVEVKGDYDKDSAQYNVNFDTCMGQLLKSIVTVNDDTRYAVGIPYSRTEYGERLSYRLILRKYSKSKVFEALNIHFLLVRDDESVEVVYPRDVTAFLSRVSSEVRAG